MEKGTIDQRKIIVAVMIALILGTASGRGLFKATSSSTSGGAGRSGELIRTAKEGEGVKAGQIYGLKDDTFKDWAEGKLEKNGDKGAGTHKLAREGGESQTAYLTSSVLDLDMFAGRKVKVWGQTFSSEKVGWLMDVGRVEVLE